MPLKLIVVVAGPEKTEKLLDAAREAGATGVTIINNARGEGMFPVKGVFGLNLDAQRDVLLFIVAAEKSREVLHRVASVGAFDDAPGTGIAVQIDVEEAFGLRTQVGSPERHDDPDA
jgi:nitrogen regulatory protein PII